MPENLHIAILLASYNGGRFLGEQLASIARQTHTNWSLWISDDGSSDATLDIIADFAESRPKNRVTTLTGPQNGSLQNFLSMIRAPTIKGDFFALADQDDVWLPDKLQRAVRHLGTISQDRPCLYGARTIVTNADLQQRTTSPLFERAPGFGNALVQSIAGGNTMLFNATARNLLMRASAGPPPVVHDWWIYQIISGAGGDVIYDPDPALLYRQHGGNLIGSNLGYRARLYRMLAVLDGRFKDWNQRNLAVLMANQHLLTKENVDLIFKLNAVRKVSGPRAVSRLRQSGLYRQSAGGNISLAMAAFLGKI